MLDELWSNESFHFSMIKGAEGMKKSLSITFMMILIISMAANFFSFNKLTAAKEETNEQAKELLKEKEQEIEQLNDKIASLEKERKNASSNQDTEEIKEGKGPAVEHKIQIEPSEKQNDLLNAGRHFIEYMYNVNPENFVVVKQNATQYMTGELAETLFPGDGIDETESDLQTRAENIQVFENEEENQAVVSYDFELKMLSNGHTEQDSAYVLLTFEDEKGTYRVSSIESINHLKGEISSIDAIGYIKSGGRLP